MTNALAGITVLDLGQVYLGPYCSMLLARLGADVIKVEPPGGEMVRQRRDVGTTAAFSLLNAGKRSIRLDLKTDQGRATLFELVKTADVLIENYAPGVMDRLGIDYPKLAAVNPRLVVGSGSGYGTTGPHGNRKAMDLTIQAMSGMMDVTGYPDGPPVKAGMAVADFMGGVHLAAGVMAALVQRGVTGRGDHVEVAMQDTVIPSLTSNLAAFLDSGGDTPARTGNRHGGLAVCPYNVYETKDGYIAILGVSDRHWGSLCDLMGSPESAHDVRFQSNEKRVAHMDTVDALVEAWTSTVTSTELQGLLAVAGVPSAPVQTLRSLFTDEHVRHRGILRQVPSPDGEQWVFGHPIRMGTSDLAAPMAAPMLGEHSEALLKEKLDLSDDQIALLREGKII